MGDKSVTQRKMTQRKVLKLVADERQFQEDSGRSIHTQPHTVVEWCAIAGDYLSEGFDLVCEGKQEESLGFLRRVAAICVAAMEQHGAPPRQGGGTYEP